MVDMKNITPNIDKSEKMTHMVVGGVLLLGAFLGFGRFLLVLFAIFMIAEGVVGWSWIPFVMEKLGLNK